MRWREIVRALDATPVIDAAPSCWTTCLDCGASTAGYADGRACLCLPCTLAELGTNLYKLALQVEFQKSAKVIEARLEKYGPPNVSPKEWITPKSRQRIR